MNNTKPKYYDEIISYLRLLEGALAEQLYEIMKIRKCNVPTYSVFQKTLRKLINNKVIKRRKVFNSSPTYFYYLEKKTTRKSMLRSIMLNQIIIDKNVLVQTKANSFEKVMKDLYLISKNKEIVSDLNYINYLLLDQKSRINKNVESPNIKIERMDAEYTIYHLALRGIYLKVNNQKVSIIVLDIENRLLESKVKKDLYDLVNMLYRYNLGKENLYLYVFCWNSEKGKQYIKMFNKVKIVFFGQGKTEKKEMYEYLISTTKSTNLNLTKYFGDRKYF